MRRVSDYGIGLGSNSFLPTFCGLVDLVYQSSLPCLAYRTSAVFSTTLISGLDHTNHYSI